MRLSTSLPLALVAVAHAHYNFPGFQFGSNAMSADWVYVRETTNHDSHGPVQDVTSSQMTCYELNPGTPANQTAAVTAGSTVTFRVDPDIQHPGPLMFYMAKAPSTAASFQPSGNVWFKIYEDKPSGLGTASVVWPNAADKTVSVTIPKCIANGDYLLRVEHIGLHSAGSSGGAQFYLACAQITVTGGSGTLNTGSLVAIPGVYKATDPGILINIWYPYVTNYTTPGPDPVSC